MDGSGDERAGPDDGQLVRATRRGDLGAFEALVGRYQRQATAVAFRLLNSREDAMDVVQDAFLRAYERLDTLSKPRRFGPWLLRIVSNLSLNFRRARALRRAEPLQWTDEPDGQHGRTARPDPSAVQPAEEASAREMSTLLADAVARLPDRQRQALVLFALEQMPQKEIAEMLGCSVEAVKWHVFAARKKLKEQFADYL